MGKILWGKGSSSEESETKSTTMRQPNKGQAVARTVRGTANSDFLEEIIIPLKGWSESSCGAGGVDDALAGSGLSTAPLDYSNSDETASEILKEIQDVLDSSDQQDERSAQKDEQILKNVIKLTYELQDVGANLAEERALKRKKERNLILLQEEMKQLKSDVAFKDEKIEQLLNKIVGLEFDLKTLRLELDNSVEQQSKMSGNHVAVLADAQRNYRKVCRDHEAKIKQLKAAHQTEVRALRKSACLTSIALNKERKRVTSINTRASPASKTLWIYLRMTVILSFLGLLSFGVYRGVTSYARILDSVCAPAAPGTQLDLSQTFSSDAPWWAPDDKKELAFSICGLRPRSRVEWRQDDARGRGSLNLYHINQDKSETLVLSKTAVSAQLESDHLLLFQKRGNVDFLKSPWSLHANQQ